VAVAWFPTQTLNDCFALADHRYVFLIGGGGKTTLMFTLARGLASSGRTVISTTSTKIFFPESAETSRVIIENDLIQIVLRLRSDLPSARHMTIGKALHHGDGKLSGFAVNELDCLRGSAVADYLFVEADGAAGRSLKAHHDCEPVVSRQAELVIVVIGADCIGRPLNDAHVHRAEHFAKLCNRTIGDPVTATDVATILFHPLGYLKALPPTTDVVVMISKAGTASRRANAARLADALRAADGRSRVKRVVIGELTGRAPFLRPNYRW